MSEHRLAIEPPGNRRFSEERARPTSYELCHPSGPACSNGGTCVTALGNDSDLPRTLNICK